MKLAVFSHKLVRYTSQGWETTGGFTIQMDALASHFDQLILCVPAVKDAGFSGSSFLAPNLVLHPLPYYDNKAVFLFSVWQLRREILTAIDKADLALVFLPGYIETLASALCQRQKLPLFQWMTKNWGQNVVVHRRGIARWVAEILWKPFLDFLMTRLTADVLTFHNGRILYNQGNPNQFIRVSSSISQRQFYVNETSDAPLKPPYKLLFVGRLSPEKGVQFLIQAVAQLVNQGMPVELHIVGEGQLKSQLQRQVNDLNLAEAVIFHGFVPQGMPLLQLYRQSHVFILPSLEDQQPKVLMEAMSQSVPVVATNVGGVPSIVGDNQRGLSVEAADHEDLAAKVQQVLSDGRLRQRLVTEGLAFATEHTVEQETENVLTVVVERLRLKGIPV